MHKNLFFLWISLLIPILFFSKESRSEEGKSGLTPTRVKLPKGPGSLEGVGENAEPNINMGLVSYKVPVQLPKGYHGFSPSLDLSYNSTNGNSEVGIGWTMTTASIERMTSRGLPHFNTEDHFSANGDEELVRLGESSIFRARFEGNFARYHWYEMENGTEGYWEAEYPDGSKAWFGANAEGEINLNSRMNGRGGVFKYHVVERQDVFGHQIIYEYSKHGDRPYLTRVAWVIRNRVPRYEALLEYSENERPDILSDAKPGREIIMARRLENIRVLVSGRLLRRYALSYEDENPDLQNHPYLSRLSRIEMFGTDDSIPYPVHHNFAYTGTFDPLCQVNPQCEAPYITNLGQVGVNLVQSRGDLIDINGDALPDFIDTTDGIHSFHQQHLNMDGQTFDAPWQSNNAIEGDVQLSSENVHMVDLDGNGFSDMVQGTGQGEAGRILWNDGTGDWRIAENFENHLPDFSRNPNYRFFDVDLDHKADVILINGVGAWFFKNTDQGRFDLEATPFEFIDEELSVGNLSFDRHGLKLADINGDGLTDIVQLSEGSARFWTNLGHGHFANPRPLFGLPEGLDENEIELADINGDSLADIVVVRAASIQYALNKNGREFEVMQTIDSVENGDIPLRDEQVAVRFADMNGSGSTDIVWVGNAIGAHYLELFPRRANLLSVIDNGIGKVIELNYGSSVEHMARDGGPDSWRHRLPHPMITLNEINLFDTFSGKTQTQNFLYHHGYYDGQERQFRGFEEVEIITFGDDSVEEGRTVHLFDVGYGDPYRKGLLLQKETQSGGTLLSTSMGQFEDCPLEDIDDPQDVEIRFICQTQSESIQQEGFPEEAWVRLRQNYQYDRYGNQTHKQNHGVVDVGGGPCLPCEANRQNDSNIQGTPCGPQCLGDEEFTQTWFVSPEQTDERWMLRTPYQTRTWGQEGSLIFTEEKMYYDGEDFEGLELGNLTLGLVKRKSQKVHAENNGTLGAERFAHDENGNAIIVRDANNHDIRLQYDEDGLILISEERVFEDEGHAPYSLIQSITLDPLLETPTESTPWLRYEAGERISPQKSTSYQYDEYGNLIALAKPGDTLETPTQTFRYDLGDPESRIVTRTRSTQGGPLDLEQIICFDGLGRQVQTRSKIAAGRYLISDFNEHNVRGFVEKQYQPYESNSQHCDYFPANGTLFVSSMFDAEGRLLRKMEPDQEEHGTPSETRIQYGPLFTVTFDREDSDENSIHRLTPTSEYSDGLGRITKIERRLNVAESISTTFTYDALGRIRSLVDAAGNEKVQQYDLLGRVMQVDDPDAGRTSMQYDEASNLIARTDARGITTQLRYDEANRLTAQWDEAAPEESLINFYFDHFGDCEEARCTHGEGNMVAIRYPLLTSENDAVAFGQDIFGYDQRGQQVYFSRTRFGRTWAFENVYDNAGRAIEAVYPGNIRIRQSYDLSGRVIGIAGYLREAAYSPRGELVRVEMENGTMTHFAHDSQMRVTELQTTGNFNETVQSLSYSFNRENQITSIVDQRLDIQDNLSLYSGTSQYQYDSLYRLTRADLDLEREQAETLLYNYDNIDNLTEKVSSKQALSSAHIGQMQYGEGGGAGPHAVSHAENMMLHYDAAGQMLSDGVQQFVWDYRGKPISSEKGGQVTARFAYDGGGERTLKIEGPKRVDYLSNSFEIRDGMGIVYVDFNGHRMAKIETFQFASELLPDLSPAIPIGNDNPNAENFQSIPDGHINIADAWILHARDEGFIENADEDPLEENQEANESAKAQNVLRTSLRTMLVGEDGEKKIFWHPNHLGSTSLSTNESGQVTQRYHHYPYGQTRHQSSHLPNYAFTGQERDTSTGLSYHSARYLHPKLGRWISPDPLFAVLDDSIFNRPFEATNLYSYTLNQPISFVDPEGEWVNFVLGAALGAAGDIAFQLSFNQSEKIDWGSVGIAALAGASGAGIVSGSNKIYKAYKIANRARTVKAAFKASQIGSNVAIDMTETKLRGKEISADELFLNQLTGELSSQVGGKVLKGISIQSKRFNHLTRDAKRLNRLATPNNNPKSKRFRRFQNFSATKKQNRINKVNKMQNKADSVLNRGEITGTAINKLGFDTLVKINESE